MYTRKRTAAAVCCMHYDTSYELPNRERRGTNRQGCQKKEHAKIQVNFEESHDLHTQHILLRPRSPFRFVLSANTKKYFLKAE